MGRNPATVLTLCRITLKSGKNLEMKQRNWGGCLCGDAAVTLRRIVALTAQERGWKVRVPMHRA